MTSPRAARLAAGLEITQVARRTGYSAAYLRRIESNWQRLASMSSAERAAYLRRNPAALPGWSTCVAIGRAIGGFNDWYSFPVSEGIGESGENEFSPPRNAKRRNTPAGTRTQRVPAIPFLTGGADDMA